MSRPSRNTDRRLIEAGKELLPVSGFRGLKIREVASKAGVNLGMFNYYFKTKRRFVEILLTELYGEFMSELKLGAQEGENCGERLRNALQHVASFARDHRRHLLPLLEEIISGNKEIMNFARLHMSKHFAVLFNLVGQCKRSGYIARDIPTFTALILLLVPLVVPNIMARVLEKYYSKTLLSVFVSPIFDTLLSDRSVRIRVDAGMKGVSPE